MKRIALILAATFPVMSFAASQNTITFNGQVTDQTCTVAVNGNAASPMILLPTVSATSLSAANSKAGETPFTVSISGCTAPTSTALAIKTAFLGNNVTSAGNLGSTGTATNVQIQLLSAPAGSAIVLEGVTSVAGLVLPSAQTETSHDFAAQYVSETGGATAGTVTASVQYALDYL